MTSSTRVTAGEITRRESTGSFLLWFGILGAPAAWTFQLLLNYSLEEWFACSPASQTRGLVLGVDVGLVATSITAALAFVAVLAGVVSIRCLKAIKPVGEAGGRARWMAIAGVMNSVLYTVIILFSFVVPLILGTCEY